MKPLTKSSPIRKAVQNIIDIDINRLLKLSISIEIIDIDFMHVTCWWKKGESWTSHDKYAGESLPNCIRQCVNLRLKT